MIMQKTKILSKKFGYWTSVVIIGIIFGLALQFAKAWTEPNQPAPNGNVGAPINTSANLQNKVGSLSISGVFLDVLNNLFVHGKIGIGKTNPVTALDVVGSIQQSDVKNSNLAADANGKIVAATGGGGGSMQQSNGCKWSEGGCVVGNYNNPGTSSVSCPDGTYVAGVKSTICQAGGNSNDNTEWASIKASAYCCNAAPGGPIIPNAMLFYGGGTHVSSDCTSKGGTLVDDGTYLFCKFAASSCPSGWTQYNNYSTTTSKTCSGIGGCPGCTTANHTWSTAVVETCTAQLKLNFGCIPDLPCTADITQIGCY
jgi:hypothetical protein